MFQPLNFKIFKRFLSSKTFLFHFMMETGAEIKKNRMGDRWRRLGYEILFKNLFQYGTTALTASRSARQKRRANLTDFATDV